MNDENGNLVYCTFNIVIDSQCEICESVIEEDEMLLEWFC